jgi:hypothetical protein
MDRLVADRHDHIPPEPDKLPSEPGQAIGVATGVSAFNEQVPAFDISNLAQVGRDEDRYGSASDGAGAPGTSIPRRYTFPACCASAANGDAVIPATEVTRNRRRSIAYSMI